MQVLLFILALILFIGLVLIHEWGHFIAARRNGVEAEEFGLFFPPRIVGKKLKSGMVLSLNWLPLGGFVKLKGEHDNDSEPGSFGAASLLAKSKIMLAGVGMNLLAAFVLLTILGWVGMPVLLSKDINSREQFHIKSDTHVSRQEVEVADVIPGSPASKIGLSGRDTIESISQGTRTYQIHTIDDIQQASKALAGQQVSVTYKHAGSTVTRQTRLNTAKAVKASDGSKGYLGVALNQLTIWRSGWSAPINALGFMWQLTVLTFEGLGHTLSGLGSLIAGLATGNHAARVHGQTQAESQVGGPIAIIEVLWGSGSLGILFVLFFIGYISLALAIMNVLPIPALDGGRLSMVLFSRGVLKRPLTQALEEKIVGVSMLVVLLLVVLISIADVKRFF